MTDLGDLPLTSSHWGTYRVEVADGQVTALHDFEHDPDPSPIGHGIVDVLAGPTRVAGPMVRQSWLEGGPGTNNHLRGKEPFVAMSWDRVNALLAAEITRVKTTFGNQAIYGGSYGWSSAGRFHHAQSQLHRFLNSAGGYTRSLNTYSFAAGEVMVPHILGTFRPFVYGGPSWDDIIDNAELVVAFGGIPLKNGQISQGGLGRHTQRASMDAAVSAGIEFVNISPLRNDVMSGARAEWVAPRPGTDVAILLALAHVLLTEGLHDRVFLDEFCVGFDQFAAYLCGETDGAAKTPEWASTIADVDVGWIRALARRMAGKRTIISTSWSLTRQDHGEQPFWAAIAVAAMLGQIGLAGRGIALGLSAMNNMGNNTVTLPAAALPQGLNAVKGFIPVARISDMLLNPGATFTYDGETYAYPDTKMMWWAGGNPFHHHQDLGRMLEAWQQLDTIVVNEWCWNANAKHADIVLAATTPLEREDIQIGPRDSLVSVMAKAIDPVGDARSDYDIFRGIAAQLGIDDDYSQAKTAEQWIEEIYESSRERSAKVGFDLPSLDQLRRDRWHDLPPPEPGDQYGAFRNGQAMRTPSGKIELFSETVAGFGHEDCLGHPAWFTPREWLGSGTDEFPLHLISNQPTFKLHSQLDHGSVSQATKVAGREPIALHPEAAAARGLADGDLALVYNNRGACLAGVVVHDGRRPDVVQLATGAWFDPIEVDGRVLCKNGNPNVLTHDHGTSSLSQGPAAHSCLVEVEKYTGPDVPVTAYDPPAIVDEYPVASPIRNIIHDRHDGHRGRPDR